MRKSSGGRDEGGKEREKERNEGFCVVMPARENLRGCEVFRETAALCKAASFSLARAHTHLRTLSPHPSSPLE